jgi:hypothetical protein
MKIVINNPRQTRKWGWGYSTTPTGDDAYSIETPDRPQYTGTLGQVRKSRREDRIFNNLGGALYNEAWFYNGQRITGIEVAGETFPFSFFDETTDRNVTLIIT